MAKIGQGGKKSFLSFAVWAVSIPAFSFIHFRISFRDFVLLVGGGGKFYN
jgi:hypothetical protein